MATWWEADPIADDAARIQRDKLDYSKEAGLRKVVAFSSEEQAEVDAREYGLADVDLAAIDKEIARAKDPAVRQVLEQEATAVKAKVLASPKAPGNWWEADPVAEQATSAADKTPTGEKQGGFFEEFFKAFKPLEGLKKPGMVTNVWNEMLNTEEGRKDLEKFAGMPLSGVIGTVHHYAKKFKWDSGTTEKVLGDLADFWEGAKQNPGKAIGEMGTGVFEEPATALLPGAAGKAVTGAAKRALAGAALGASSGAAASIPKQVAEMGEATLSQTMSDSAPSALLGTVFGQLGGKGKAKSPAMRAMDLDEIEALAQEKIEAVSKDKPLLEQKPAEVVDAEVVAKTTAPQTRVADEAAPQQGVYDDIEAEEVELAAPPSHAQTENVLQSADDALQNNASGESAASAEAINRLRQEQAAGQDRYKFNTRTGDITPLTTADRVDAKAYPDEIVVQKGVGRDPFTILDQGRNVHNGAAAVGRFQQKLNSQTGNIDPRLLGALGITATGAAAGATLSDDPIEGSLAGALAAWVGKWGGGKAIEGAKKLAPTGREIADVTGAKSVSYLDQVGEVSPTAKALRNEFEYTESSATPVKPSFFERVSLNTGKFATQLQDGLDKVSTQVLGIVPKNLNDELVAALRGGKVSEAVAGAVRPVRKLLDDVHVYAKAAGLDLEYVKGYFPRVYRSDVLESATGAKQWDELLGKYGIEAEEARHIRDVIVNKEGVLLRGDAARPSDPRSIKQRTLAPGQARKRAAEVSRVLAGIPDEKLAPFLQGNAYNALSHYVENIVRRAEYARSFGADESKLNGMVQRIIEESNQAGRPVTQAEVQRIYDIADTLQRSYKPIASRIGKQANQWIATTEQILTLPLATISSLTEPLLVLERGRFSSAMKAVPATLNHLARSTARTVYKGIPKAEATRAIENVGLGLDTSLAQLLASKEAPAGALAERVTASFGGEANKISSAFFKLNLLSQWTRLNRVWAFETGTRMIQDNLSALAAGATGRKQKQLTRELAELGVDANEGLAWIQRGAQKEDPFYESVKAGGLRFTNEVVMNPRSTTLPLWHSNPHYRLFSQLKGYQTAFGNTVLKRWFDKIVRRGPVEGAKNFVNVAATGAAMTIAAMAANDFRDFVQYGSEGNPRHKKESESERVMRAVERVGFLGVGQFAMDAMYAHRFGSSGIEQIAGPAPSRASRIARGVGEALDGKPASLQREFKRAIPLANIARESESERKERLERERRERRRERRND